MPPSLFRLVLNNKFLFLNFLFLILIASSCFLAPHLPIPSYSLQNLTEASSPPTSLHWLGTDILGRDILSRILYGGQISFTIGLLATLVSITIGTAYGITSGLLGGKTDHLMMKFLETLLSIPFTLIVIILMVFIGKGLLPMLLAIGMVEWLTMARLIRGQVLKIKSLPYVQAAYCLGQSPLKIILKHILPNILDTILVCATLTIPSVMLMESFISFLGLGVQAPMASWGLLIHDGTLSMERSPWMLIFPSAFFSLSLLSLNFIGDSLRDLLDPHLKKSS